MKIMKRGGYRRGQVRGYKEQRKGGGREKIDENEGKKKR